ncbi:MAG: SulP family inorganic anion transporter [Rubrivivax sp.]
MNGLDRARHGSGAGAGIVGTLAVVSVPLSLGLLAFAPLGSQATRQGLAAAAVGTVLGGLLYGAISRARLPAAGPSSATALVLAALVLQLAGDGAVLDGSSAGALRVVAGCGLAVSLSGALQILLARAGLARLARLVPRPVLGGFMNGVALLIALSQLPLLLGLAPGTPAARWFATGQPLALLFGLATLALVLALERWRPRWPALLVALAVGTVLHLLASRQWPGAGIGLRIGAVPVPWPDLPGVLALAASQGLEVLWPHAPAILTTAAVLALIGALESLLGLLALDEQLTARHDPRHELQALGLVNLLTGPLGALPTVVLRARATAIMRAGGAGAGGVLAGSASMAVLFYAATPLLGLLPLPVLGGIMVAIAISLVDRWAGGLLLRWWRGEDSDDLRAGLAVMGAVCVVTLWQGFAAGVSLGVLLSMLVFIVRMNRSLLRAQFSAADRPSRRFYPAPLETRLRPLRPLVRVWELEGALFFGNADRLVAMADAWPATHRALVLDLRRVSSIDETGASALAKVAAVLQRRQVLVLASGAAEGSAADRALRAFRVELPRQPDIDRATEAAEAHLLGDDVHSTLMGVPLSGSELLRGLDEAQRQQVMALMTPRRLAPGEFLFRQGDPADGLYVVSQGSISLIGTNEGVSQRFLSVSPGMMLGETAMLDGGGRSADALADTAAVLHHLSTASLDELGRQHADVALQMHRNISIYLSSRLRAASAAWWSGQV